MLLLVRWEPRVDASYPSDIILWIRGLGVPLHFWAGLTFPTIGKALGEVKEVDIDNRMFQVMLNGFKPLWFETTVEFYYGEKIAVTLGYER